MKLLSKLTPEAEALFGDLPKEMITKKSRVYVDKLPLPRCCILRTGDLVLLGGEADEGCLSYLKNKILPFEIYEKYGRITFICPDETWKKALSETFPCRCEVAGNRLEADFRQLDRAQNAPAEELVLQIARRFLPEAQLAERVAQGASTYVYRVRAGERVCYARFLPENASFGAEVRAHREALARGVGAPKILFFEDREPLTGFSMMISEEVPGVSLGDRWPEESSSILQEAGAQLALLHLVPVEGFGWIDRGEYDCLKGEHPTFDDYFCEYLEDDLTTLHFCALSQEKREQAARYMEEARRVLYTEKAVLVHGDLDISHIFHSGGCFTGLIDFGEIRGNHRFFDLSTLLLFDKTPGKEAFHALLRGYRRVSPLGPEDLRGIYLMALFIALRFAAKKAETDSSEFWLCLFKKQLEETQGIT